MNWNLLDPRLVALAAGVIVIVAVGAWLYARRRRRMTAGLRRKFGPEYDRAVLTHGSKAEAKLADREKRIDSLNIRDLDAMEHQRYVKQWEAVQSRFVDSPKGAIAEADDLVSSVMKVRGYPVADFDQRLPTFLSTILGSSKTTGRATRLLSVLEKKEQPPKNSEPR